MLKVCVVCGKKFDALNSAKCCSTECIRAHHNEWLRKYRRRQKAECPERLLEYNRKWRAEHPGKMHEANCRYHAKHPEVSRRSSRAYYATTRGKALWIATSHNRRVKLSGISMTADTVLELKSEYSGFCPYCGCKIVRGHVDHITPVSKGGTNDRTNLAWVCKNCNSLKGNKSLLTFLLQRKEAQCRTR